MAVGNAVGGIVAESVSPHVTLGLGSLFALASPILFTIGMRGVLKPATRVTGEQALEAVVHPEVRRLLMEELSRLEAPLVFLEIPLLFEKGWEGRLHGTLLVAAPLEERVRRVMARSGQLPSARCTFASSSGGRSPSMSNTALP